MSGYTLGIDLGGTKIMTVVVSPEGRVAGEARLDTLAHEGPDAVIARLLQSAEQAVAQAGLRMADLEAIGVCAPGPLDVTTGVVLSPPNLPGWIDIPLRARLAQALGRPVYLDNDANAAALAEWRLGAGRGTRDMIYLTVSTGIGGGAIVDGRLQHGKMGAAAEFGHVILEPDGPRCNCGNRGCLEALASGTAIARAYAERAARRAAGGNEAFAAKTVTARDVFARQAEGDPLAAEVIASAVRYLAIGIANFVHIYNPERVVVGGGVASAGDALFTPLREQVRSYVFPHLRDSFTIEPAALGTHVGALGAALLGLAAG
ncbi:glucokinase [Alicyclobacillus cellulosilyticus]|uniref:Glucokinase n=1 Tax=Alicyclobacillus cellulosilyticus TaxID=1003997 RepID=A0A917K9M8_9BACL|nr:ROK family protein [Alicyclobacillus cellulosilyticus]GGJ05498.1 glucokinase [Alicyclobacillus cellulosilyticus]